MTNKDDITTINKTWTIRMKLKRARETTTMTIMAMLVSNKEKEMTTERMTEQEKSDDVKDTRKEDNDDRTRVTKTQQNHEQRQSTAREKRYEWKNACEQPTRDDAIQHDGPRKRPNELTMTMTSDDRRQGL